jgi:hypothetical protein
MADFTTSNTTKSAVRKLAAPLADVTAFDNLVQGVITNNPFQCVAYNAQGVNHPPVEAGKAGYTARVVYQDALAKTIAVIHDQGADHCILHERCQPHRCRHHDCNRLWRYAGP